MTGMLLLPLSLPSGERQVEDSNTIALAEDVEIRDVSGSFEISIHTTRPQASIITADIAAAPFQVMNSEE
jgi:hypothetical protein